MKLIGIIATLLRITSSQSDIVPLGGQKDDNNCLAAAGYTWCESSQSCIRQWVTPCEDNYNDCNDCLSRQRNGENIACPTNCDLISIKDPCSSGCPPPFPCPAPGPDCEFTPPPKDICGCSTGCGTIKCSTHISLEGETCGGYMIPEFRNRCGNNLECVNTMGPYIADAPGTCQQPCTTFRDQWGNCVDGDCETWFDGCNTCRVEDNILTSCTEEACFTNDSIARCIDDQLTSQVPQIPSNCATWFDGCNTCSVQNGRANACTLMMCFRSEQPYCQAFHTGRLNENDVCYQFCEDNSQPPINRIDDCPKHTRCISRLTQNQVSMIAYDTCGKRAKQCILIGGH